MIAIKGIEMDLYLACVGDLSLVPLPEDALRAIDPVMQALRIIPRALFVLEANE